MQKHFNALKYFADCGDGDDWSKDPDLEVGVHTPLEEFGGTTRGSLKGT